MRSPRKPGYEPLALAPPSWVGGASSPQLSYIGGTDRASDLTISDRHFEGVAHPAVFVREYDNVIIERCTFSACVRQLIALQLCTNVTIRNCAYFDMAGPYGNFVLANGCDGVTVEDCWGYNTLGESDGGDIVTFFKTHNGTVRRCRFMGVSPSTAAVGILVGDGDVPGGSAGDTIVIEDNLLIDLPIGAIGTNNTVRRNVVLIRGLDSDLDGLQNGIVTQRNNYPTNLMGPTVVSDNEVLMFSSTGQQRNGVQVGDDPVVTATGNPVSPLIDEYSRWDLTGYHAYP